MLLGSSILELALGMIFFYFLLSILCSHINELIAGIFNRRGKDLIKGVQDLLNYPPATGDTRAPTEELPESAGETMRLIKRHFDKNEFGDLLLLHPLIQGLATQSLSPLSRKRTPDYIPDHTFSLALIGTLLDVSDFMEQYGDRRSDPPARQSTRRAAAAPPAEPDLMSDERALASIRASIQHLPEGPRRTLMPFVEGSADSIEELRANIERWYNAKMDRVSGVYKRRTQFWLLVIGLIATLMLNADSLSVATALWQYPTLRQAIAEQSRQVASASPSPAPSGALGSAPSEPLEQVQRDVQNLLIFPITWGEACAYNRWLDLTIRADAQGQPTQEPGRVAPLDLPNCRPQRSDLSTWTIKVIGFIITAVAISLGASFWFDLLRKVSNIRSSGPAPGEPDATTSAQKSRRV